MILAADFGSNAEVKAMFFWFNEPASEQRKK